MNIEAKIAELAKQAAPLRLLADDDEAKAMLNSFIIEINSLRALQSKGETETDGEPVKKRGRLAKVEGSDA